MNTSNAFDYILLFSYISMHILNKNISSIPIRSMKMRNSKYTILNNDSAHTVLSSMYLIN